MGFTIYLKSDPRCYNDLLLPSAIKLILDATLDATSIKDTGTSC